MFSAGSFALTLLGCGGPPVPASAILVTFGEMRPEQLGIYGGSGTPEIDALAGGGLVLERAYTSSPELTPALASTLSGLSTSTHGLRAARDGALSDEIVTLSEALAGAGFRTSASTSAFGARAEWGLAQGFKDFDGSAPPTGRSLDGAVDEAIFWIGADMPEPYFLWVHLEEAEPDEGTLARIDGQIGRLQRAVEGSARPTHWVLTAARGAAPAIDSVAPLSDAQVRVPLIVRPAEPIDGRHVERPAVSVVDVAPTILGLLGLAPLGGADGIDLSPLLKPGGSVSRAPVPFASSELSRRFGWPTALGVTTGEYTRTVGVADALVEAGRSNGADLSGQLPREVQRMSGAMPAGAASPASLSLEMLDADVWSALASSASRSPGAEAAASLLARSVEARALLGDDPRAAAERWRAIAASAPGAVEPLLGRALALRLQGRPAEAASIYASIEGPMASLYRARALREAGAPDEALAIAEALLAELPGDPAASAERVYALSEIKGLEAALAAADAAAGEPWSDGAAGVLLQAAGDPRAAARLESSAKEGMPRRGVNAALGHLARDAGDISRAAALFSLELRRFPERWEVRLALAELWWDAQVWDKAVDEYLRLYAAREELDIHLRYIDALAKNERYEEADALLAPLLRSRSKDPDVLLLKANLLDELGDPVGSRRYFELARMQLRQQGR